MSAIAAASVAAITGVGGYLNAKYHIGQDVKMLRQKKAGEKHYASLGEFPYFTAHACMVPHTDNSYYLANELLPSFVFDKELYERRNLTSAQSERNGNARGTPSLPMLPNTRTKCASGPAIKRTPGKKCTTARSNGRISSWLEASRRARW